MAMRMVERGDAGPMSWAAPILFVAANFVIAYFALSTLYRLVRGSLLHMPAAAAPSSTAVASTQA